MVFESMTIDEDVLKELQANIARRLTPQPVKIRADFEVTCFGNEGIDAIKRALKEGEKIETETIPVKVKLVAPPLYVLLTNSTDKQGGIDLLEKALENIEKSIKGEGGDLQVKMKVGHTSLASSLPALTFSLSVHSQRPFPRPRTKSSSSSWPVSRRRTPRSRATRTRKEKSRSFHKSGLPSSQKRAYKEHCLAQCDSAPSVRLDCSY